MDQSDLESALADFVPQVTYLEQTGSTNAVARQLALEGAPHRALVVAGFQTEGRGRFDRTWFAPPGCCLLFSQVLRLKCDAEQLPLANLAASIALSQALSKLGLVSSLKWPNDVLINGRKVAGILAEVVSQYGSRGLVQESKPEHAVVLGVGLNVNVEEFPDELRAMATSLSLEGGHSFDLIETLIQFQIRFEILLELFPKDVAETYGKMSETVGRLVRVRSGNSIVEGKAVRIDPLGHLVLEGGHTITAGDLTYES